MKNLITNKFNNK